MTISNVNGISFQTANSGGGAATDSVQQIASESDCKCAEAASGLGSQPPEMTPEDKNETAAGNSAGDYSAKPAVKDSIRLTSAGAAGKKAEKQQRNRDNCKRHVKRQYAGDDFSGVCHEASKKYRAVSPQNGKDRRDSQGRN